MLGRCLGNAAQRRARTARRALLHCRPNQRRQRAGLVGDAALHFGRRCGDGRQQPARAVRCAALLPRHCHQRRQRAGIVGKEPHQLGLLDDAGERSTRVARRLVPLDRARERRQRTRLVGDAALEAAAGAGDAAERLARVAGRVLARRRRGHERRQRARRGHKGVQRGGGRCASSVGAARCHTCECADQGGAGSSAAAASAADGAAQRLGGARGHALGRARSAGGTREQPRSNFRTAAIVVVILQKLGTA